MKNLGDVESIILQNKILLMLDVKWYQFFNQNNPKFEVIIDKDGRISLRGPKVNLSPHRDYPTADQEETK